MDVPCATCLTSCAKYRMTSNRPDPPESTRKTALLGETQSALENRNLYRRHMSGILSATTIFQTGTVCMLDSVLQKREEKYITDDIRVKFEEAGLYRSMIVKVSAGKDGGRHCPHRAKCRPACMYDAILTVF